LNVTALILAAGKGTRMKSDLPKVLHPVAGKPMISHVIDSCIEAGIKDIVLICGYKSAEVKKYARQAYKKVKFVIQKPQKGTAHAITAAIKARVPMKKHILILSGDVPLISPDTIKGLINEASKKSVSAVIAVSKVKNPRGYGRVLTSKKRGILRIIEEKDASPAQKKIRLINGGVYVIVNHILKKYINKVKINKKKGEYYLTDIAGLMSENSLKIKEKQADYTELSGINDRAQLAEAGKIKNKKVLEKLSKNGITIGDFDTVFIDSNVQIGKGTVIKPFTVIKGKSKIGKNCIIGPSAHIRPGTVIGDSCKIGNYVEIKNSRIGSRVNVAHLSYVGDAEIGSRTNIGAGTITANYDGVKKHKTRIGVNVKVGSNVVFVAPVRVGSNVTVAAGSVVTDNVPPGALVIARARQVVKKNRKKRRRK